MERPDESEFNGYEGETVALKSQTGASQMTISLDDLIGSLDDGAPYRIVATVLDLRRRQSDDFHPAPPRGQRLGRDRTVPVPLCRRNAVRPGL